MQTQFALTIGGKTKRSNLGQHPVTIDWENLPEASKDFAAAYGLRQYLADAMAGKESEADAKAAIEARVAKLVSGDLSRTKGEAAERADTPMGRALKNARAAIRTRAKAQNKKLDKDQIQAAAKAWVEKDLRWLAEATEQLKSEAAAAAAIAEDDGLDDILADILGEMEDDEEDEDGELEDETGDE